MILENDNWEKKDNMSYITLLTYFWFGRSIPQSVAVVEENLYNILNQGN